MNLDTITCADALAFARGLPAGSVDCVVTSPPYFGLRDYAVPGQIGLEDRPAEYVWKLTALFDAILPALKLTGTLWLNLGDSYVGGGRGGNPPDSQHQKQATSSGSLTVQHKRLDVPGVRPKSLLGIPWRVAFALQDAGWIVRSDIIWAKPNPMPESVKDRPTRAHEYVFLLTKHERYWYDAPAIAEAAVSDGGGDFSARYVAAQPEHGGDSTGRWSRQARQERGDTRNARSVWTITPEQTPFAHFATMPQALAEKCIRAGCPPGGVVYDPFMGSGTTALVARRLNRRFIGSELNPEYVALANQRLAKPFAVDMLEVR